MTNSEVESTIAAAERAFDRKRDRVVELENALRGAENNLERSMVEHNRERIRTQIRRIEADLASARGALFDARTALDEAWALRKEPERQIAVEGTKWLVFQNENGQSVSGSAHSTCRNKFASKSREDWRTLIDS